MRLRLFPTVEAPRQARQGVASLGTKIDSISLSDVSTVISELVTVCVAYGASKAIEISLALDDGELEGVLCDDGPGVRALDRARRQRDNSLLLRLIDELVQEWETNTAQNQIFFRMAVRRV